MPSASVFKRLSESRMLCRAHSWASLLPFRQHVWMSKGANAVSHYHRRFLCFIKYWEWHLRSMFTRLHRAFLCLIFLLVIPPKHWENNLWGTKVMFLGNKMTFKEWKLSLITILITLEGKTSLYPSLAARWKSRPSFVRHLLSRHSRSWRRLSLYFMPWCPWKELIK